MSVRQPKRVSLPGDSSILEKKKKTSSYVILRGLFLYFWGMVRQSFFVPLCIRRFFVVKKACPLFIFFFFLWSIFFSLTACTDSTEPEVVVFPRDREFYAIFPNDPKLGDSIEANLATGIMMIVHPGGRYTLSFGVDPTHEAPKMQLFRSYKHRDGERYGLSKMKTLKPEISGGRYVFSFVCEENERTSWVLTLVEDDTFYQGKTKDVRFEGSGRYSDTLSLNLVSVGLIDPIEGAPSMDSLSRLLISAFRKNYTSIVIDTIYVNYAEKHPTLGEKYPADRHWHAESPSSDTKLSEFGNWPAKGVTEALDIVLVHRIDELNSLGYAGLFASNLVGGERSTVVVGSHVLSNAGERPLAAEEIVKVAVHETGHFFGLKHTTSTWADLESYQDLSILEDGFEDTPYCPELLKSGLYKKGSSTVKSDYSMPAQVFKMLDRTAYGIAFDEDNCPDSYLFMFPVSSDNSMREFSKQQLKFLKQSLMLIPH
jgi:hypothetical protein